MCLFLRTLSINTFAIDNGEKLFSFCLLKHIFVSLDRQMSIQTICCTHIQSSNYFYRFQEKAGIAKLLDAEAKAKEIIEAAKRGE